MYTFDFNLIFDLEPVLGPTALEDLVVQKILPTSPQVSCHWTTEDWYHGVVHVLIDTPKHNSERSKQRNVRRDPILQWPKLLQRVRLVSETCLLNTKNEF